MWFEDFENFPCVFDFVQKEVAKSFLSSQKIELMTVF